jgi:hypothetical protein
VAAKKRAGCEIGGRAYRLVLIAKKKPAKKQPAKRARKATARKAPSRAVPAPAPLSRRDFARAVERATVRALPWHPNSDKSLIRDVWTEAGPDLGGMSFEAFAARLVAERFPLDRIDLVSALGPERTAANDLMGRGPFAIRKGVTLA